MHQQPEDRHELTARLEDELAAVFWRSPAHRDSGLERIIDAHPEFEGALRRRFEELQEIAAERMSPDGSTLAVPDPDMIGPYRILSRLGEGGFGVVYLAEQDDPRRRVALKVLKSAQANQQSLTRFKQELRTLAAMSVPYIAQVYDAGEDGATGRPYFALEYIEGSQSLTRYCRGANLGLRERVELFQLVCEGVQHAHQRGILHRDLKPQNILVTDESGAPMPKLIDFGIARASNPDDSSSVAVSREGQFLGTPAYTSPEQARGTNDLDSRTDVYSLGVVLYELLTGTRPIPDHELGDARSQIELVELLERRSIDTPSSRTTSMGKEAATDSAALRGDLDWIVMRSMAKDRELRYMTPIALAEDLQRYLDDEPVLAGPPSVSYRIRKFARRYRLQVTAAALLLLALVAGATGTTWFMFEANDRLAEFDRLSVLVKLDEAESAQARLYPASAVLEPTIAGWLREFGRPLAEELPRVRAAIRDLKSRAGKPSTTTNLDPAAQGHLESLRRRATALRLAEDVRAGRQSVPGAEMPTDLPTDLEKVNEFAWVRVSWNPQERIWGEEALALEIAQRLINTAKTPNYLDTLAWAYFAMGMDSAAMAASLEAMKIAPENGGGDYAIRLDRLEEAIQDAATALQNANTELEQAEALRLRFDRRSDQFLYGALLEAESRLESFVGPLGSLRDVERRLVWSQRIESLTEHHPNAEVSWTQAAAAIAKADGVVADERYGERPITLRPQLGLVPIGKNPRTGLWEFYHLRSAFDPTSGADPGDLEIPRHEPDGSIPMRDHTGIVFVLVPGGTLRMGSQAEHPGGANFDPAHEQDERLGEATVQPFFIARHELTQGQWLRLCRSRANPSDYKIGTPLGEREVTAVHPVENVDWTTSAELLERLGLRLPSDSEWEYGCRAGTDTVWFTGSEEDSLQGYANLLDPIGKQALGSKEPSVTFEDGHIIHAPVGSFGSNPFGLHDTHGNVWEWCATRVGKYRVIRGGSFAQVVHLARCASRETQAESYRLNIIGLRAARSLR